MEQDTQARLEVADLVALAGRDRRAAGAVLRDQATDFLLTADRRLSDRERAMLRGVLRGLVRELELALRQQLIALCGGREGVPDAVMARLADTEIELAFRGLAGALLNGRSLLRRALWRAREHSLFLHLVPPGMTDLAGGAAGRGNIVETLASHADSRLSQAAVDYFIAEAARLDEFREPILPARELPDDCRARLSWRIAASLRRDLLAQEGVSMVALDAAMEAAADAVIAAAAMRPRDPVEVLADAVFKSGMANGEFLLTAKREARIPLFIALFARLADTDRDTISSVLFDPDGDGLAIACRAADLSEPAFAELTADVQASISTGPGDDHSRSAFVAGKVAFFGTLAGAPCREALRYWRPTSPYIDAIMEAE